MILPAFGLEAWASIPATFLPLMTTVIAYIGWNEKSRRHKVAAQKLINTINKWDKKTEVHRSSKSIMTAFVLTCEDIIREEQLAWRSAALTKESELEAILDRGSSISRQTPEIVKKLS